MDNKTNKLKLKKSTETISWNLVGIDKYKDVDSETARLCHILENDDTEGYACKVLVQFDNINSTKIPLYTRLYNEGDTLYSNEYYFADAYKISDGTFYENVNTRQTHTFNSTITDKYVIAYYKQYPNSIELYMGAESPSDDFNFPSRVIFYNYIANQSDFILSTVGSCTFGDYDIKSSLTFFNCDLRNATRFDIYEIIGSYQYPNQIIYCINEKTNNYLDLSNIVDLSFTNNTISKIPNLILKSLTKTKYSFYSMEYLINVPNIINTAQITDWTDTFYACQSLISVPLLDLSGATDCENMFGACSSLKYLGGFKGLKVDLNLSLCEKLVRASLLNVLNNLADVTELGTEPTLTLAADSYYKLTSEEIVIGTNKGWVIAYA